MASRSEAYKISIDIDNTLFFDGITLDGWRATAESDLRKGNLDAAIKRCSDEKKNNGKSGEAEATLMLAQARIWTSNSGKNQEALDAAEEAQSLYNALGGDLENAVVKHTLARAHLAGKENFDEAFEAATDALAMFKKVGNKLCEAASLNTLAVCELLRGNGDECMQRAEASLEMFREAGSLPGQASAMHTKAILYTAAKEFSEGVRQSQEAAAILKDAGDDRRYIAALLATAESAMQSGALCEAIDASQDALQELEKLGDKSGQVTVLLSLVGLYFKQDMFAVGIDTAQNVISISKDTGDKKHEAQAWFMTAQLKRAKSAAGGLQWPPKQGLIQEELEDMQKAAQTAVDLFAELGDDEGEAGSRFELCHAYLAKSDTQAGTREIQISQKKFRMVGDITGECIALIIGAQVQSAQNEKELAMNTMEKALGLAQEKEQPFLERVCKEWIKKLEPPKRIEKGKDAPAGSVLGFGSTPESEGGGISSAVYAQCIHRCLMGGDIMGEHFFENPSQTSALEGALGIRFPFYRNRPPPGQEFDHQACVQAWQRPPDAPKVKLIATSGKAAGAVQKATGANLNLKKPRLPPMATPPAKPQAASARAQGGDVLGGRLPEVPEDVHNDMVALAAKGEIPVTKPEDRAVYITKRPTFYGDPIFRDALRFGYIHPTANQVPRGMKWKSVRAGAFKLLPAAA